MCLRSGFDIPWTAILHIAQTTHLPSLKVSTWVVSIFSTKRALWMTLFMTMTTPQSPAAVSEAACGFKRFKGPSALIAVAAGRMIR